MFVVINGLSKGGAEVSRRRWISIELRIGFLFLLILK